MFAMATEQIDINATIKYLLSHTNNLFKAGAVLIIGLILVKFVNSLLGKALKKSSFDPNVKKFFSICVKSVLWFLLAFTVCSSLNIEMSSFVAAFSIVGVAVSLAIKDTLSDVAGSLQIMIARPYKIGDFIEVNGISGTVKDIGFSYTTIAAMDNHRILIPNGTLSSATIANYSASDTRQVQVNVGIAYNSDIDLAKQTALNIMQNLPTVLPDPAPTAEVDALGDSSINLSCRCRCNRIDYRTTLVALTEQLVPAFDKAGIEIPYNKLDVHILSQKQDQ